MSVIERDVVHQSVDKDGNQTIDYPLARLGWIEDTAEIKDTPAAKDYIPVVDMADGGQMKKIPAIVLTDAAAKAAAAQTAAESAGTKAASALEKAAAAQTAAESAGTQAASALEKAAAAENAGDSSTQAIAELRQLIAAAQSDVSSKIKIEFASYMGTGTFGKDNPCSLTFSFAPRLVVFNYRNISRQNYYPRFGPSEYAIPVVNMDVLPTTFTRYNGFRDLTSEDNGSMAKKSADGKTLSWYYDGTSSTGADIQLNTAEWVYQFYALG